LYYRLTDDFRLSNITYDLPHESRWETPPLTTEEKQHLATLLNQKFYYLGKGAQSYAFVSEDQLYVIKFFKFKHLKPNVFVDLLPPIPPFKKYKHQSIERKERKLIGVFDGYALAYREHREDSALLFLHLLPTDTLRQTVTLVDKIGIERQVNLDEMVFLVQKKGETLRNRLRHLLNENRLEEAKQTLAGVLQMYLSEYKKGLYDRDHGVMQNTGFVGDQPFHLDVGKFSHDDRMQNMAFYKKDFEHVIWKMDHWIKESYPQYDAELSPFLAEQYQQATGEVFDAAAIDPQQFKRNRRKNIPSV
jgi:hypothetical protein